MVKKARTGTFMCMVECTIPTEFGQARFKPGSTIGTHKAPSHYWADVSKYEPNTPYREILESILEDEFGIKNGEHYNDETRDDRLQHWFVEKMRDRLETEKKGNLMAYAESIKAIVHPAWPSWKIAQAIEEREAEIWAETKQLPKKEMK